MTSIKKQGKNIVLMPVSVCYDRIFEMRNLATEMISDEPTDFNTIDVFKYITKLKPD
jgi:glycerol-3-phosphate O-acyltransferase